jgi:hypothetical protein
MLQTKHLYPDRTSEVRDPRSNDSSRGIGKADFVPGLIRCIRSVKLVPRFGDADKCIIGHGCNIPNMAAFHYMTFSLLHNRRTHAFPCHRDAVLVYPGRMLFERSTTSSDAAVHRFAGIGVSVAKFYLKALNATRAKNIPSFIRRATELTLIGSLRCV